MRGLARSAGSDERGELAGLDRAGRGPRSAQRRRGRRRRPPSRRLARPAGSGTTRRAARPGRAPSALGSDGRPGRSTIVGLEVEVLEDALRRARARTGRSSETRSSWTIGKKQPRLQGGEGDERARAELRPAAVSQSQPRDQVDQRRGEREEACDDGEERLAGHLLAHLQRGQAVVLARGSGRPRAPGAPKTLASRTPGHRQRLLGDRAHVGQRGLRASAATLRRARPTRYVQQEEHRQQHEGHRRQLPGQHHHGHEGCDHGDDVGQDGGRRAR